jgi:hypothetical protein
MASAARGGGSSSRSDNDGVNVGQECPTHRGRSLSWTLQEPRQCLGFFVLCETGNDLRTRKIEAGWRFVAGRTFLSGISEGHILPTRAQRFAP